MNVIIGELAKSFKDEGMFAYVNLIQRKEKELKCDVLTHQAWSGAQYIDSILQSKFLVCIPFLFSLFFCLSLLSIDLPFECYPSILIFYTMLLYNVYTNFFFI